MGLWKGRFTLPFLITSTATVLVTFINFEHEYSITPIHRICYPILKLPQKMIPPYETIFLVHELILKPQKFLNLKNGIACIHYFNLTEPIFFYGSCKYVCD